MVQPILNVDVPADVGKYMTLRDSMIAVDNAVSESLTVEKTSGCTKI